MDWSVKSSVPYNSDAFFNQTLITDNGFREYDVRWQLSRLEKPEGEINPNGFMILGRAFGTYARRVLNRDEVVVGYDFREYSQNLSRSFVLGLLWSGVHVKDIGLAMSPMLYFAQHLLNVHAGAILTASHNDNGWTGLKLADGLSSTLGPEGIATFKKIVKGGHFTSGAGTYETVEGVFEAYVEDIVRGEPLQHPVDMVVATGNGTGGCFAPEALRALGCNVAEQHCEMDWTFPNFNPNPEDLVFLRDIRAETKRRHAKIGIGIDGDGDRIGVVDDTDDEVFTDKVGLLVARWIAGHSPGRTIVIDVKSTGLFFTDPVLKEHNMDIKMVATGHSYVKKAVVEYNAVAGLERSGHWFFSEPYGRGYDDAVRASAILLRMLDEEDESLHSLLMKLPPTHQSATLQAQCPDNVKYEVVKTVTAQYEQDKETGERIAGKPVKHINTVNGVRFTLEDESWGLIRASSNLPTLVLVVESPNSHKQAVEIMAHIKSRLEATGKTGDYDQQWP